MRGALLVACLGAVIAVALGSACTSELDPSFEPTPTPTTTRTPPPTPVPTDLTITSGVVLNTCLNVASASGTWLRISGAATSTLSTGTRIVLHQAVETVFSMDDGEPPDVIAVDGTEAGRYWLDYVYGTQTSAGTLLVEVGLDATGLGTDDTQRAVQLCTVPVFRNLEVTSAGAVLPPQVWDGRRGGVIAIEVLERFRLAGTLTTLGTGFEEGTVNLAFPLPPSKTDCTTPDAIETSGLFAFRGDGIGARKGENGETGRTRIANAGGGGGCRESGGGGGGNAGAGGRGGNQSTKSDASETATTWGVGGAALSANAPRLLFGGGGGAGHGNGGTDPGSGGRGGGVILVLASHLDGAGGIVFAPGATAEDVAETSACDGAGGGGAGGTVLLQARTPSSVDFVYVQGGAGGSITGLGLAVGDLCGPGGGGAGGQIHHYNVTIGDTFPQGGQPGLAGTDRRGAEIGGEGVDRTWAVPFVPGS